MKTAYPHRSLTPPPSRPPRSASAPPAPPREPPVYEHPIPRRRNSTNSSNPQKSPTIDKPPSFDIVYITGSQALSFITDDEISELEQLSDELGEYERVPPRYILQHEYLYLVETIYAGPDDVIAFAKFPMPPRGYSKKVKKARRKMLKLGITVHTRFPKYDNVFAEICHPGDP